MTLPLRSPFQLLLEVLNVARSPSAHSYKREFEPTLISVG